MVKQDGPGRQALACSSTKNPCPICGRTQDGDCRISDGLVLCHHGSSHHPPAGLKKGEVIPGGWAYAGETSDGRAATFVTDRPLARLADPSDAPPQSLPDGQELHYSANLRVKVLVRSGSKSHIPHHRSVTSGPWVKGAGSDEWPLWRQDEAVASGKGQWITEAEGEKCCDWLRAAGLVAVSQPGHDHKLASITRRYGELKVAGVAGIAYLADNDPTGIAKGKRCEQAAASVGLPFKLLRAADIWPNLPAGGSIDDAPGTASDRGAAVLAAIAGHQPAKPKQLTFEERWELLERHAAGLAASTWSSMKAIASLASKASELDINRLSQRQLEQLLEQSQRQLRAKSEPIKAGGTFQITPAAFAVQGLFRHALNLLVGQSGAGKSRLAAACMAAWLRGDKTWLGRDLNGIEARNRHALIIGPDQSLEDWHLTLAPVGLSWLANQDDATAVQIHDRLTLYGLETGIQLDADGLNVIRRWVDAHPGGMVLIDSLSACLPAGIDEDKSGAAAPVHKLNEALGDAWGVLTHHTRKGAGKEGNLGIGAGRGSGAIDAAVSRVIGLGLTYRMENGVMVPQESDPRRELLSTKRGGKTEHLIISSDSSGLWRLHGEAEALKAQERTQRAIAGLTEAQSDVLSAIEAADGWITTRGVVEAQGEPYDGKDARSAKARNVLKRLEVLGLVESRRVGVERSYRIKETQSYQGSNQSEPPLTEELKLTSSISSITGITGVSLVREVVRDGSELVRTSSIAGITGVSARAQSYQGSNQPEPPRAEPEPPFELPKTQSYQQSNQSNYLELTAGSELVQPMLTGLPLDPVGSAYDVMTADQR